MRKGIILILLFLSCFAGLSAQEKNIFGELVIGTTTDLEEFKRLADEHFKREFSATCSIRSVETETRRHTGPSQHYQDNKIYFRDESQYQLARYILKVGNFVYDYLIWYEYKTF